MAVHQSENTSLKLRYKKWGFAVVAVILLAIFIEIAAFVGYWIVARPQIVVNCGQRRKE